MNDVDVDLDLAWGGDTKSRIYHVLMRGMLKVFNEGKYDQAETLASGYLDQADLPIYFRCVCHLVFACRRDAFAVAHAKRAIKLLDKARPKVKGEHFPQQLYTQAQFILAEAEADQEGDIKIHNAQQAAELGVGEELEDGAEAGVGVTPAGPSEESSGLMDNDHAVGGPNVETRQAANEGFLTPGREAGREQSTSPARPEPREPRILTPTATQPDQQDATTSQEDAETKDGDA